MTSQDVIELFSATGALLEGHFVYASGRHGSQFLQAARVLQYPEHTERLCRALAERFGEDGIELVAGPATGGIVLAYETARLLGCRSVFAEKDGHGGMRVGRGFHIPPDVRVLIVEDIITTGGSVLKVIGHLKQRGAHIAAVGALIDRSGGEAAFPCRFEALAEFTLESYPPDNIPPELAQQPITETDAITR